MKTWNGTTKLWMAASLGLAFALSAAATPTVNGLFYGDGDYMKYSLVGSNPGRGDMYMYLDGATLYVAVVVSTNVNDNVFGSNPDYTQSAGWKPLHGVDKLIGSDNMEFNLTVGSTTWQWKQDYAYQTGGAWLSDHRGPDAQDGTPPPGYVSASSLQWNFINSTWDYTMGGQSQDGWKSPDANANNDVTDEDGFPTWSALHQWEWAMVYEFSVDLSAYAGQKVSVQTISAHNSPSKDGKEDVPIDPQDLLDFGDAPDSYGTTLAANGARHYIVVGGPRLGALVDAEPDGRPTVGANGDDLNGLDDEDGVVFLTPVVASTTGLVQVVGTAGAKLNAWIDFNANGVFDAGEQIATDYILSGGADVISYVIPLSAPPLEPLYARFRVNTAGGLGPLGLAVDGEVEDYLIAAARVDYIWPTRVVLTDFYVERLDGVLSVVWSTSDEQGAIGFFLERWDAATGAYVRVNDALVPAAFDSYEPRDYRVVDAGAPASGTVTYRLLELENTGAVNRYGPFVFDLDAAAGGGQEEQSTVGTDAPAQDGGDADGDGNDGVGDLALEAPEAPRVTSVQGVNGSVVLRWASVPGAVYGIERTASLTGEFLPLVSGLPSTAPENVVILVDGAQAAFFRIVREN